MEKQNIQMATNSIGFTVSYIHFIMAQFLCLK